MRTADQQAVLDTLMKDPDDARPLVMQAAANVPAQVKETLGLSQTHEAVYFTALCLATSRDTDTIASQLHAEYSDGTTPWESLHTKARSVYYTLVAVVADAFELQLHPTHHTIVPSQPHFPNIELSRV